MKQLFLLLLLLAAPTALLAQRPSGSAPAIAGIPPGGGYSYPETRSTYQLRADSALQALDKSQAVTGILYDRVAGTAYLDLFNRAHNDLDTSNVYHFLQAYYELKSAAGGALDGLPYRQLLIDDANTNRRNGTIVLGTLRYRFHTIDTLAVRDGLLSWDNATNPPRLLDVAGRSRSPYILNEAVVAAALADSLAGNGAVSFRLDARYLFTNTGATLTSASINFDDGGVTRTLTPGQTVAVNYGSTGYKTLRYTLFYADGGQFTTCSRLWVRISTAPCPTCRTLAAEPPLP